MTDPLQPRRMTVEEYLRFEGESPIRHEYLAGDVYAMSGATARHNTLAGSIFARLFAAADNGPCRVFMSDMRLKVADDRYYYPDLVVVCTPMGDLDLVAEDPCVVVEVTSPSTDRVDRTEKLDAYRGVPTLRAYLVVDHRRRRVQRHWRETPEGTWRYDEIVGEDETPIAVPCLDVTLTLDAIYRRVSVPAVGEPDADYDPVEQDGSAQE